MTSKTTSFILFKSQKFRTYYTGRGRRSGTPRWGYLSHRYRGGPKPSIFDPLGNRNSALRINYQKVIQL